MSTVTLHEQGQVEPEKTTSTPIPQIPWGRVVGVRRALFGNQLQNMVRLGRAAGQIGTFRVGDAPVVILNAPSLIDEVLVKQASSFCVSRKEGLIQRLLVRNGLPLVDGEFHRRQRQILAPALQARQIARYAENIAAAAERVQAAWQDGQTLDIVGEMKRLTMACHWRTFLGLDLPPNEDALTDENALSGAFLLLMQCLEDNARCSPLRQPFAGPPRRRTLVGAINTLNAEINGLIRQRREAADETACDVLSLLLQAQGSDGSRMEDAQVHDEIVAMLLAGYETVAGAITWVWHLLSTHPAHQERLRQELDAVLGGRTPTYQDLPRLPFALQVIKEAMRLYPTGGNITRRAACDVRLGDYALGAGTEIWILPYLMNRDPQAFPDPERFNPDRFAPDAEKQLPRYAFMPFGGGTHYCIGSHLALMQNQLILAAIAQKVDLTSLPRPRVEPEMLTALWPKHGLRARVARRVF